MWRAWSMAYPLGTGRIPFEREQLMVNSVLGGWQVSAINTMQAGTPFNLTYTPNAAQQVRRR